MRLDIAYRLHFRYDAPVSESQNEIRVRPRDDPRQQVLSYRLMTAPPTRVLQTRDYFGTTVDHLGIRSAHRELLVTAEASVETVPSQDAKAPVSCDRLSDQDFVNAHVEYLAPSQHVQWGKLINEVASWAIRGYDQEVTARIQAVNEAVRSVLAYERGTTAIGVTLEELVDGGRGVCQDFAHLAVGMLRCLGIPARYVSGYLFAMDETQPGDALSDAVSIDVTDAGLGFASEAERSLLGFPQGHDAESACAAADAAASNTRTAPDRADVDRADTGRTGADRLSTDRAGADRPGSNGSGSDATGCSDRPDPAAVGAVGSTPSAVSVQTHAWIEAAVPGSGWLAADPTNGGPVGERHVVIGHGRDYGDVPPVRGVYTGSASAEVQAEVIIAQPAVPASMVTEPIRRRSSMASRSSSAPSDQQFAAQQQSSQQQ